MTWPVKGNHFGASFFKALGIGYNRYTFPRRLKDALVVSAFSLISLFVHGDDHPSLPIFRWPPKIPGHMTHT